MTQPINALVREVLQEALTCQGRARAAADRLLAWLSPIMGHTSLLTPVRSGAKNCMNGAKAFFDTNVLLYMYGGDAGKQARAERALSAIYWGWPYVTEHTGGSGVLRG